MSDDARARVARARRELARAEGQLAARVRPWHERIALHRTSLLIGGGLLGGVALATVPLKRWSRAGALLIGGGAWLARSAILPALLGALWSESRVRSTAARRPGDNAESPVSPGT